MFMKQCTCVACVCFFFFNDTATTEIYTLSLHDALPIFSIHRMIKILQGGRLNGVAVKFACSTSVTRGSTVRIPGTDLCTDRKSTRPELQSRQYLVCRLLLEKKKRSSSRLLLLHLPLVRS